MGNVVFVPKFSFTPLVSDFFCKEDSFLFFLHEMEKLDKMKKAAGVGDTIM